MIDAPQRDVTKATGASVAPFINPRASSSEDLIGMAKETVSEDKISIDVPLQLSDHQEARRGTRDYWRITAALFVFSSFLWWSWPRSWISSCTRPTLTPETVVVVSGNDVPDIGFPESVLRNWGQYSPWIPAGSYVPPPLGCVVNQVSFPSALFLSPNPSIDKTTCSP